METAKMTDISAAAKLVFGNDRILILTHVNPDGDTLGSACALCLALRSAGKQANISNSEPIPQKYHFMTELVPDEDFAPEFVMSVDVADEKLLGSKNQNLWGGKISLAIDHHSTNRLFAAETCLEGESASCAEIIYLMIKAMGVAVSKDMANCLFTGVTTDTGCFRYYNVTSRTHRIAAELIDCGAEAGMINELMFERKTLAQLELQRRCLERLELLFSGRMALFTITARMSEETGCDESDFDPIVMLSRQIEGVKLGVTLKERANGSVRASVRSNEEVNAAAFCSAFGGGGHVRAAGCSFSCTMDEARKLVIAEAEKLFGPVTK